VKHVILLRVFVIVWRRIQEVSTKKSRLYHQVSATVQDRASWRCLVSLCKAISYVGSTL
jgi:hypothetical protein